MYYFDRLVVTHPYNDECHNYMGDNFVEFITNNYPIMMDDGREVNLLDFFPNMRQGICYHVTATDVISVILITRKIKGFKLLIGKSKYIDFQPDLILTPTTRKTESLLPESSLMRDIKDMLSKDNNTSFMSFLHQTISNRYSRHLVKISPLQMAGFGICNDIPTYYQDFRENNGICLEDSIYFHRKSISSEIKTMQIMTLRDLVKILLIIKEVVLMYFPKEIFHNISSYF